MAIMANWCANRNYCANIYGYWNWHVYPLEAVKMTKYYPAQIQSADERAEIQRRKRVLAEQLRKETKEAQKQ